VVSANLAFAALAGVERAQVVGRPIWEVVLVTPLPEPSEGLISVSYSTLATHMEHHFQLSCAPFSGAENEPLRILVVHDVSDRVALEHALKQKDRLAALGMLAAGVAHEVNTPITGISSYAQMLLSDTPPDDPRHEMLKKVERQTFRASRIVNNLLEFARKRSGEHGPVDLGVLVDDTLDLLRERIHKHGIHLVWEAPARPVEVAGNDGELQQVVTNLLLNACEAMGAQGGTLTVTLGEEDGLTTVVVADTGEGIPAERLEKIFEPFFTTKASSGGTGLGLAISHEIVTHHGGHLRADSEPGKGSRFTMELPSLSSSG
jgi:signal transduction histidine kinase